MGLRTRFVHGFSTFCVIGGALACSKEIEAPRDDFGPQGGSAAQAGSAGSAGSAAGSGGAPAGTGGTAGATATAGNGGAPAGGAPGSSGSAAGGDGAGGDGASGGGGDASGGKGGGAGAPGQGGGGGGTPPGKPGAVNLGDGVLDIWPLGDSITLGPAGGYRNDLYTALVEDGLDVDMVGTQYDTSTMVDDKDHDGHSGFTIANARGAIDGWLSSMKTPDVVLVMLGTNDEAWWTVKAPTETKDELVDLVDHLLEKLPNAVVIAATIPPQSSANVEPLDRDRAEMTREYNAALKSALAAHDAAGDRVFVADVNAVLTLSDLYDGIHPTREAHTKIAQAFYDVLSPLLPE